MSVGRNDPCPCGSGKKYKKCCFAKDEAQRSAELAARAEAARAASAESTAESSKATKRTGFKGSGGKGAGAAPSRQAPATKGTNLPRRGAV